MQRLKVSSSKCPRPGNHVAYAFAETWTDAVMLAETGGASLRVLSIRTLMWFDKIASASFCRRSIAMLLRETGALTPPELYPSNAIDATYDNKSKAHGLFKKFMLPQLWVPVELQDIEQYDLTSERVTQCVQKLQAKLLRFMQKHRSGNATDFVIKGSDATYSSTYRKFTYHSGRGRHGRTEPELLNLLRDIVVGQHQHCIGIQPFNASLRACEYRVWIVAYDCPTSAKRQLHPILTVMTRPDDSKPGVKFMHAVTPDAASAELVLCTELVKEMLQHPRAQAFWSQLKKDLCAIRLDVFVHNGRAHFNEMAPPPDAVTFTSTHESSLVSIIAKDTTLRLFALATIKK